VTGADGYGAERLSEEEHARLAGELADAMLADLQFRAASRADRWRLAREAIPAGTDPWAGRNAQRQACDRAQLMAHERYDQLEGRLDDLAAELLASPAYQQASSADARKKAAGRFLIPRADGFSPPTSLIRNELHARAQKLAKAARIPERACSDAIRGRAPAGSRRDMRPSATRRCQKPDRFPSPGSG
jgi:hypothetical protein